MSLDGGTDADKNTVDSRCLLMMFPSDQSSVVKVIHVSLDAFLHASGSRQQQTEP